MTVHTHLVLVVQELLRRKQAGLGYLQVEH